MRYVALAFILISLPAFIGLLRQFPQRRALALTAIGAMLFVGGNLSLDASIIAWPLWNGTVRGMEISPVDSLAVALIMTRQRAGRRLPFWGVLAFYGATIGLSLIPASVPMATVFSCWQYLRLLVLFAAIGGECGDRRARAALLIGLALGIMLQAGYVIPQKLGGMVQATGTMFHQNTLGMVVEMALLPLIAALLGGERGWLLKVGIVAGLIVIVGGGSRAAMGMAGAGIVVLAIFSLWRQVTPTKLKMIGLGALALVVIVPLGFMTLKDRFGAKSMVTQEQERAAFERAARAMANDHPFGVGANMYVPTANLDGYADRAGVAWNFANRSAPVHNAYLLARAETGWAGQFAYMLILFVPLLGGLRFAFRNRTGPVGDMALGSSVALVVLIIHNGYEFAGLTYPVLSMTIVNLAVIASITRVRRRKPGPGRPERIPQPT